MAKMNIFLCCLSLLLCLVVCSGSEQSKWDEKQADKTWCVAKVSASPARLQDFMNYACLKMSCRAIRPGGSCYQPNTIQNHASYVLDLFFRTFGQCQSDIATPAVTDPSWGKCHYP